MLQDMLACLDFCPVESPYVMLSKGSLMRLRDTVSAATTEAEIEDIQSSCCTVQLALVGQLTSSLATAREDLARQNRTATADKAKELKEQQNRALVAQREEEQSMRLAAQKQLEKVGLGEHSCSEPR
eukprot:7107163-Alexandrium_andersonii.AAC.1